MIEKLPLTEDSFECQLAVVCHEFCLDHNDDTRIAAVNYFHSLPTNTHEYDTQTLGAYIHRAYAMKMTFDLSHAIDVKRRAEKAEAEKDGPDLTVVKPQLNN